MFLLALREYQRCTSWSQTCALGTEPNILLTSAIVQRESCQVWGFYLRLYNVALCNNPYSKVHGANMGAAWVLSAPARWAPCWPHQPCYQGSYHPVWHTLYPTKMNKVLMRFVLLCAYDESMWIHAIYLPVLFKVTLLISGQSHGYPWSREVILKDMGKSVITYPAVTWRNNNIIIMSKRRCTFVLA